MTPPTDCQDGYGDDDSSRAPRHHDERSADTHRGHLVRHGQHARDGTSRAAPASCRPRGIQTPAARAADSACWRRASASARESRSRPTFSFHNRDPRAPIYKNRQWKTGFIGGDYRWLDGDGVGGRNLDARTRRHVEEHLALPVLVAAGEMDAHSRGHVLVLLVVAEAPAEPPVVGSQTSDVATVLNPHAGIIQPRHGVTKTADCFRSSSMPARPADARLSYNPGLFRFQRPRSSPRSLLETR